MLIAAATRRASCRSSIEQQLPNEVCPSLWSYSCIDSPMTSCPCSSSRAAATDESTPPDIATTIRIRNLRGPRGPQDHEYPKTTKRRRHEDTKKRNQLFVFFVTSCSSCLRGWISRGNGLSSEPTQLLHEPRQHFDDAVDLFVARKQAEAEPQRVLRAMRREAHRAQHVRGFERAGR